MPQAIAVATVAGRRLTASASRIGPSPPATAPTAAHVKPCVSKAATGRLPPTNSPDTPPANNPVRPTRVAINAAVFVALPSSARPGQVIAGSPRPRVTPTVHAAVATATAAAARPAIAATRHVAPISPPGTRSGSVAESTMMEHLIRAGSAAAGTDFASVEQPRKRWAATASTPRPVICIPLHCILFLRCGKITATSEAAALVIRAVATLLVRSARRHKIPLREAQRIAVGVIHVELARPPALIDGALVNHPGRLRIARRLESPRPEPANQRVHVGREYGDRLTELAVSAMAGQEDRRTFAHENAEG